MTRFPVSFKWQVQLSVLRFFKQLFCRKGRKRKRPGANQLAAMGVEPKIGVKHHPCS